MVPIDTLSATKGEWPPPLRPSDRPLRGIRPQTASSLPIPLTRSSPRTSHFPLPSSPPLFLPVSSRRPHGSVPTASHIRISPVLSPHDDVASLACASACFACSACASPPPTAVGAEWVPSSAPCLVLSCKQARRQTTERQGRQLSVLTPRMRRSNSRSGVFHDVRGRSC